MEVASVLWEHANPAPLQMDARGPLGVALFLLLSWGASLYIDEPAICACLGMSKLAKGVPVKAHRFIPAVMWITSVVTLSALTILSLRHEDRSGRTPFLVTAFLSLNLQVLIFVTYAANLKWSIVAYLCAISAAAYAYDFALFPLISTVDTALLSSPPCLALSSKLASLGCFTVASRTDSRTESRPDSRTGQQNAMPRPALATTTTAAAAPPSPSVAEAVGSSVVSSTASSDCPFPGAQQWSCLKGAVLGSAYLAGIALEHLSAEGDPTYRMLQPLWDLILSAGGDYIHNSLFAVTVATVTYVLVCFYFSILDLTKHTPTKVQKAWFPSTTDMYAAAWPQLIVYGLGQVQVWSLWLFYPQKYNILLPPTAPSIIALTSHLAICLIAGDFLIYWEHRIMHAVPYLRTKIHSVHHEYTAVFSWAGEGSGLAVFSWAGEGSGLAVFSWAGGSILLRTSSLLPASAPLSSSFPPTP
eukprot:CAMPEP_0174754674 /NCGR_PEP_ID=MMETSP1094-20130205/105853_1 /TAXON_ID=156173 /ORGANISM="Chrysochromulina brevifilum, Strain UTEX LB 985" /LENGTH=471 /DNA_ID=CAMNT_0015960553 /DNA_START=45 /DNA_END=1460 /DNA_ORIENTATION=+